MAIFDRALEFCLQWEGGFVDNPNDLGGKTNKGITQRVYTDWQEQTMTAYRSVEEITDEEVIEIYQALYWEPAQCDRMSDRLSIVMFDTAVNFGVGGAVQFLQENLALQGDGDWGAKTEAAFQSCNQDELAVKICNDRYNYRVQRVYEQPNQETFLVGWQRRDRALLEFIRKEETPMATTKTYVILTAKQITYIKRKPLQSYELSLTDRSEFLPGQTIECVILKDEANHKLVELKTTWRGFYNWYIFPDHWEFPKTGAPVVSQSIDWRNPGQKISKYFTVAEVTQNDDRRIPSDRAVIRNITDLAKQLDKVRKDWGQPIGVTSWYRPPTVNAEVGGVPDSQHINGSAADIYPIGGDIYEFQSWLDGFWGDRALGYGARWGFVHLDLRTGGIRWDY